MDIHVDWSTTAAIVGTLATVLAFIYGIISNRKSDKGDDNDNDKECKEESIDFEKRITKLEDNADDRGLKIQKLTDQYSILDRQIDKNNTSTVDNLSRIESRLEKMIDLIIRIKDK